MEKEKNVYVTGLIRGSFDINLTVIFRGKCEKMLCLNTFNNVEIKHLFFFLFRMVMREKPRDFHQDLQAHNIPGSKRGTKTMDQRVRHFCMWLKNTFQDFRESAHEKYLSRLLVFPQITF